MRGGHFAIWANVMGAGVALGIAAPPTVAAPTLAAPVSSGAVAPGHRAKAHGAAQARSPALRPAFRNVTVTLPQDFDQEYPAGAGVDALNTHCRACHSPSMVLTQPPLSREEWRKEVGKMMDVFKAPVPQDQVDIITQYLVNLSQGHDK